MATLVCVTTAWGVGTASVLRLPSGRLVRGRGVRRPLPEGAAPPVALYLPACPPAASCFLAGLLDPLAGLLAAVRSRRRCQRSSWGVGTCRVRAGRDRLPGRAWANRNGAGVPSRPGRAAWP